MTFSKLAPPPILLIYFGGLIVASLYALHSATPSTGDEMPAVDLPHLAAETTESDDFLPRLSFGPGAAEIDRAKARNVFDPQRGNTFSSESDPEEIADRSNISDIPRAPEVLMLGYTAIGNRKMALLQKSQTGEELWVRKGDKIDGWEITQLSSDTVQMAYRNETIVVTTSR